MRPANWISSRVDRLRCENFNGFAACEWDERNRCRYVALIDIVTSDQLAVRRDRRSERILMGDLHRLAAIDRNFPDAKSTRAKRCINDPFTIGRDRLVKSRRIGQQLRVTAIDVHSPYLRARARRTED